MAKETAVIETGVDKLVELVRAKKRISIPDAAKSLGVGNVVVEEWADFLEEEGIISIEYKFATPYLVERKLTKDEVKQKEKRFHGEREGFIRKAEVTLALLDREGETFQKFKDNFEKLKKELGDDLKHVEADLKELEKFEDLKRGVDKQITEHEQEFRNRIDVYEKEIEREEQKFRVILENISQEEEKLDKRRLETLSLREKELNIRKKLSQFQDYIKRIDEAVKKEESSVGNSGEHIKRLKGLAERVKKDILAKKGIGKDLLREGEEHKRKIGAIQRQVVEKISKNQEQIQDQIAQGRVSTKKFREFFDRKVQIEKLLIELDKQKSDLEMELIRIIKSAKALEVSKTDTKGHIKELQTAFEQIKKKKETFEQEAKKLGSLLE